MGCRWPRRGPGAGSVRSSHSASRRGAQGRAGVLALARFEGRFQFLLGAVEQLADAGAVFGREFAHLFTDERQGAFAAERLDANGFQFLGRGRGLDARQGTGLQFLYGIFNHECGDLIVTRGDILTTKARRTRRKHGEAQRGDAEARRKTQRKARKYAEGAERLTLYDGV